MGIYSERISTGLLTNSAANIGSAVLSNEVWKDIEFHFTNNDASAAIGVTIYIIPSGGSAGDTTTFLKESGASGFILGPGETRSWSTEQVLIAGDQIQGKASTTNKISYYASRKRLTQG